MCSWPTRRNQCIGQSAFSAHVSLPRKTCWAHRMVAHATLRETGHHTSPVSYTHLTLPTICSV
eukprot:13609224-Alexandrium_andersonii.AAC.1